MRKTIQEKITLNYLQSEDILWQFVYVRKEKGKTFSKNR